MTDDLVSRTDVARRLKISTKTVDRLRRAGRLPWVDVSGGRGKRPTVRFSLIDIEDFKASMRRGHEGIA